MRVSLRMSSRRSTRLSAVVQAGASAASRVPPWRGERTACRGRWTAYERLGLSMVVDLWAGGVLLNLLLAGLGRISGGVIASSRRRGETQSPISGSGSGQSCSGSRSRSSADRRPPSRTVASRFAGSTCRMNSRQRPQGGST